MSLNYTTETDGRVEYRNHWGLTFYLPGQPPSRRETLSAGGNRLDAQRMMRQQPRVGVS